MGVGGGGAESKQMKENEGGWEAGKWNMGAGSGSGGGV